VLSTVAAGRGTAVKKKTAAALELIQQLAAGQHGVVSRAQLRGAKLPRATLFRLLEGQCEEVGCNVYRVRGAGTSWHQSVMIAVLESGGGAAVSHHTAARLHGLAGLPWKVEAKPHVTVPYGRYRLAESAILHRARKAPRIIRKARIPTVGIFETMLGLADLGDKRLVARTLESAARGRTSFLGWMQKELERLGGGRRGQRLLAEVLALRAAREESLDSPLENDVELMFVKLGLPPHATHYNLCDAEGKFIAEVDFAWPPLKVVVQAMGHGPRRDRDVWVKDVRQCRAIEKEGWKLLVITPDDFIDQQEVLEAWLISNVLEPSRREPLPTARASPDSSSRAGRAPSSPPSRPPSPPARLPSPARARGPSPRRGDG
jgi:hypothetical protein